MQNSSPQYTTSVQPQGGQILASISQILQNQYQPLDTTFVPGGVLPKGGMVPPYDSNFVPCFEAPLVFAAAEERAVSVAPQAFAAAPRGLSKFNEKSVVPPQKKNFGCC